MPPTGAGVGIGVGGGTSSYAPMSQPLPCGRPTPRWSAKTVVPQPLTPGGMWSIAGAAGLERVRLGSAGRVWSQRAQKRVDLWQVVRGSQTASAVAVKVVAKRIDGTEVVEAISAGCLLRHDAAGQVQSAGAVIPDTAALATIVLRLTVLFVKVAVPPLKMPPPSAALLPLTVLFVTVIGM
jgi:hypothetical protein